MGETLHKAARVIAGQVGGAAVLRGLKEKELVVLYDKLRVFASERYYGRLSADDLVMQAFADVLAHKRTWNENYPPFDNLCWIVRSIASNQLDKEKRLSPLELDTESGPGLTLPSAQPSAAELYEADERQRGLIKLLLSAVGDDSLLRRLVALFMDWEVWRPQEMATELNVGEQEIYEAKRRIQRRLVRLRKKS